MTCCHVKLRSVKVQVRSKRLGQVWFSLELKFNSLELDSELGRLVFIALCMRFMVSVGDTIEIIFLIEIVPLLQINRVA